MSTNKSIEFLKGPLVGVTDLGQQPLMWIRHKGPQDSHLDKIRGGWS